MHRHAPPAIRGKLPKERADRLRRLGDAAGAGNVDLAIGILKKDAALINEIDMLGNTPLFRALPHLDAVKAFIALGADVRHLNHLGMSAAHYAVKQPEAVLETLVAAGLDLTAIDRSGRTPLGAAAELMPASTACAMIRRLAALGRGALASPRYALQYALMRRNDSEVFCQLVSSGADINCRDEAGNTFAHNLARNKPTSHWDNKFDLPRDRAERLSQMELVISQGIDLDLPDAEGNTALHLALATGNVKCVRLLAPAMACLDAPNTAGSSPLELIMPEKSSRGRGGNEMLHEMLRLLLSNGADANRRLRAGTRPIHFLLDDNTLSMAALLLLYGADPTPEQPSQRIQRDLLERCERLIKTEMGKPIKIP